MFSIFPDLENMGLDTLIRQIRQVLTEILRILVWWLLISIIINFMKIAQTCQGDTLANLDQEGPNVKKQQNMLCRRNCTVPPSGGWTMRVDNL